FSRFVQSCFSISRACGLRFGVCRRMPYQTPGGSDGVQTATVRRPIDGDRAKRARPRSTCRQKTPLACRRWRTYLDPLLDSEMRPRSLEERVPVYQCRTGETAYQTTAPDRFQ